MSKVFPYADGACSGNPGPGGFAWALFTVDDTSTPISGGGSANRTTNNIMEPAALRHRLEAVMSATANLSIPLALTLVVWGGYQF